MKRTLVIAHDFPFPPNHGGRYDMFFRIKSLYELGIELDVIATVNNNEYPTTSEINHFAKYVTNIFLLKRRKNLRCLISLKPFQVCSRKLEITDNLKNVTERYYDFVILEDFYTWNIYKDICKFLNHQKTFIRLHNNNFLYFQQLGQSTRNPLKKIFFIQEAFKFFFFERKVLKNNTNINLLPISFDDYKKLHKNHQHVYWLPPAIDIKNLKPYKRHTNKEINVLFVGNLFTDNNIEGIVWFLKNIHPFLKREINNYKLIIAGKTKEKKIPLLEKYIKYDKNIVFSNSPSSEELEIIYNKATIFINPILHGAGVKIKNIDALIHGLPVVTTSRGNEGTGFIDNKHILIANNPKKFIEKIRLLAANQELRKKLVTNAQKFLKLEYNHKDKLKYILGLL